MSSFSLERLPNKDPNISQTLPLKNIRILDFSRLYPGPLSTLILSDLGAEVIRVEDSTGKGGDMLRGTPSYFQALNRGKKSVSLNFKNSSDRMKFRQQLLPTCQVLVESFRPTVLENLLGIKDIDYLLTTYPNLIIVRISAFGQTKTSWSHVPAHDMNSLARAGIFKLSPQDTQMHTPPIQSIDLLTAYSTSTQVSAALHQISQRKISPDNQNQTLTRGILIDVSMMDIAISTGILSLSYHFSTGKPVGNGIDFLTGRPCYDIYATKEKGGFLSVGCLEPHFWKKFVVEIGLPELQSLSEFGMATGVKGKQVKNRIEEKLRGKTAREWEEFFIDPKIALPVVRLREPEELHGDPLVVDRHMALSLSSTDVYNDVKEGDTDENFEVVLPGLDHVHFLKAKNDHQLAPRLGEHNKIFLGGATDSGYSSRKLQGSNKSKL